MAREIWSTDFVTDSRTGTDGPLWWGESAQEGCQRTASRHGLAGGNGCPLWVGRVHAGGMFGKRIAILTAVSIVVSCPHGKG